MNQRPDTPTPEDWWFIAERLRMVADHMFGQITVESNRYQWSVVDNDDVRIRDLQTDGVRTISRIKWEALFDADLPSRPTAAVLQAWRQEDQPHES
jgi:hypothetical protein